ncbi:Jacalin-like lectin domain protein [Ceratobasidium sp. AG-Ba]|nr:Jacalin-like lectin domain protein [Ceratobasidium sp. AG-Ba]
MPEQHHSSAWIKEQDDLISETIETQKSRNLNYVHYGWSIEASSTLTLEAECRIAQDHEANHSGQWTTKRTIVRRLLLDISPEELLCSPNFEKDVREAVGKPSLVDKYKALDRVFRVWGDVVPIVFEIGALLSISDLSSNFTQLSSTESAFRLEDLATYTTAKVNIQGGSTSDAPEELITWLSKTRHPSRWSLARVVRVIPIVDILPDDIKQLLETLYSGLLSYRPLVLDGNSVGGYSFDGTPHALKTIKSIVVHSDSTVDSLQLSYADGMITESYGGPGGNKQSFHLQPGIFTPSLPPTLVTFTFSSIDEFIVEIMVWTDDETMCAIQFISNKGRVSPHYGGDNGVPRVLNSEGGALSAFSGKIKKNSYWKRDMVYRVQAIWRHNLAPLGLTRGHQYSDYIGGSSGVPFNDWPYSKPAETAFISEISIQGEKYIESIQATYTMSHLGQTSFVQKPRHGNTTGQGRAFVLRPGEYFVKAHGRYDDYIIQLCLVTSRGRSTPVHGGSGHGNEFKCEAPDGMCLSFILGKSSKYLHGIMFVWAPI